MQYDRKITISAGNNRRAMNWTAQTMLISELWARLQTPARGTEPLAEYLNMKKAQQDDLKDVGGFMAGTLSGPRRKANAVTGRDILTLDLDNVPAGGTEDVLRRVDGLGCGYCIYSTRKHSPAAPRLRVLLPLDRTVSADEYEPLARKMAEYIGLELADPTTFEVSRLMYWPSCCADSQYIYTWQDKPLLSANGLLARYDDWRDCRLWPQVPGAVSLPKLAVKQGDPEGKKGVVGAFCRTYDVFRAMDELIPGMYEPVDSMPGRYTYLGGSTTGGAVIYDDGKFLYSHHATDPCSGRLVNAFDLVRLHRFGDMDDEAQPGTPTNRLPSYRAMCELAVQDAGVAALMSQERYQEAVQDFEGVAGDNDEDPANWMTLLLLAAVILSTVLVMVTIISLLSAFAKTIKEAQTYVMPVMLVVMGLGIVGMFGGGASQELAEYCIPLYNSVQCMVGVFSFSVLPLGVAATVGVNVVVTLVGVVVLARMFNSEKIIFSK